MFTGIVEGIGCLRGTMGAPSVGLHLLIETAARFRDELEVGDSLSVSGVCLTVSEAKGDIVGVDISPETLARTYFSHLKVGEKLNIERSLKVGDRLHGHWVTGHIDGVGTIVQIEGYKDFKSFVLGLPGELCTDLILKGSIAVDGVSLTINRCSDRTVEVMLIPKTLESTTFGEKKVGDPVQVELDLIGKYVKKWMKHEYN